MAGFIESHVAEGLVRRGDSVIGLDILNTFYDPARKRANLAAVEKTASGGGDFSFIEGDIPGRELVDDLFARFNCEGVAHLAAMAGVGVSVKDPYLYYDVNLTGTLVCLPAYGCRTRSMYCICRPRFPRPRLRLGYSVGSITSTTLPR